MVDRRLHDDLRKIYLHLKAPRFDLHRRGVRWRRAARRARRGAVCRDRRSLQLPPIQARVSAWRVLFRPIQARVKPDIAVASDITSLAVTPR